MNRTPVATSVQLARAEALGKALTLRGWNGRLEPQDEHPGAVAASVHTRLGICLLILTLGRRHGQMVEITAGTSTGQRGEGGRRVREVKRSWRMTAYDPPTQAVLAAATATFDHKSGPLEFAGWTVEHALARKVGGNAMSYTTDAAVLRGAKVRATRFTRSDGAVLATFHIPTYNPPCEHCTHHGELGDTGGWIITGPGFAAEATAHTPPVVIDAFTRALPAQLPDEPAPSANTQPFEPQRGAKPIPADARTMLGTRLKAVVC